MKTLKNILTILTVLATFLTSAQNTFRNYGSIKIHGNTDVGFHVNLINDGIFDDNMGMVGFYSDKYGLTISGNSIPVFYDTEVAVDGGLTLETSVGVLNNVNLITGNVNTIRTGTSIYSQFMDNSFYTGESDFSKINGYGALSNKDIFTFPVGDESRLRPLTIESVATNAMAKCAYFNEDPNFSISLSGKFDTQETATEFLSVSNKEFWRLESNIPSRVTLTWDVDSDVSSLAEYLTDLKVVGWSKAENMWHNLGNVAVEGGLQYGSVRSDTFIPDDYEILTLGGNAELLEKFSTIELDNYYLTPNGDGQNDNLVIQGLEVSAHNSIQIFNRHGQLVYSKENYQNDFAGVANVQLTVDRPKGLETGIYFYICTLHDLRQRHQGYLYLNN